MKKVVAVSFEGRSVKVVRAAVSGREIRVTETLALEEPGFDEFLYRERTKEFLVVKSFREHYLETFLVPSTRKKYLARIIETEIGKRCQFKEYSSIHSVSAEKSVDGRKVVEVSAFAVRSGELYDLIDRFEAAGKTVTAVYPEVFSLNSMLGPLGRPALCAADSAEGKDFFLVKDGVVVFLRELRRHEESSGETEVRNIEMTLNHCRQTIRTNPGSVILTGRLSDEFSEGSAVSVPVACLAPPAGLRACNVAFLDYSKAVSAFYAKSVLDISPKEFKKNRLLTRLLHYSTAALLLLTALGGAHTLRLLKSASEVESERAGITRKLPDLKAVIGSYELELAKTREYGEVIKSAVRAKEALSASGLLKKLGLTDTDGVSVESISVTRTDNVLTLAVDGRGGKESLAAAERDYERFAGSLASLRGLTVRSSEFDLKERRFKVEAEQR